MEIVDDGVLGLYEEAGRISYLRSCPCLVVRTARPDQSAHAFIVATRAALGGGRGASFEGWEYKARRVWRHFHCRGQASVQEGFGKSHVRGTLGGLTGDFLRDSIWEEDIDCSFCQTI